MNIVHLENWSLVINESDKNLYLAPEQLSRSLRGRVYGHDKYPDGKFVRTSNVIWTQGRRVKTESGTMYLLNKPDPNYSAWVLSTTNKDIDLDNPLKLCFNDTEEIEN